MEIDTGRSALLLLHYQTDIISIFAEAGINAYVARMSDLAQKARKVGVPVFFVKIGFTADYREVSPNNKNGQMIRSFGLFISDDVPKSLFVEGDTVLIGHRASAFKGTSLDAQLRARGIDTLLMAGITTSGVVLSTVAEASDRDYRILLIEDGCFEPDAAAQRALMTVAFATRADVVFSADIAEAL